MSTKFTKLSAVISDNPGSQRNLSSGSMSNAVELRIVEGEEKTDQSIITYSSTQVVQKTIEKDDSDCESTPLICVACSADSKIPHVIQVTRLRVANLCCAGEEKIIMSTLEGVFGIDNVAVNVIGRYAIVRHCTVQCCAPVSKVMDLLNAKNLGVTIQEVAGDDDAEEETIDKVQALHVLLVCILFCIGLVFHFIPALHLASMAVYLTSVIIGILPILYASYVTVILRRTIDIHILMIIAVAGAVAAEEYFDASLLVALFVGSELIESYAMMQVRKAVRASSTVPAKEAYLANGDKVAVDSLKVGDVLAVRAGEMILGDGIVVKGEGVVDESALTGESAPISKKLGGAVLSGTLVQNGYMEIQLTADTAGSTMSRLNQAVQDVQADKGEYAKMVDQFALYWTPGVLVGTLLFVLIGGGVSGDWNLFVFRGLVLLVLACPCAIVIAAPIPSVCAIKNAAKHGVLIRGSAVIECMGTVDAVALDKTGTLTKGLFTVSEKLLLSEEVLAKGEAPLFDPLELAAAIEQKSTHPLANAIVADFCGCIAEMAETDVVMPSVRKIKVVDGVGVTGWVQVGDDWKFVEIGNEKMLREHGGTIRTSAKQKALMAAFNERSVGKVVLLVAVDDAIEVMLALADEVRPEAKAFVATLRGMDMNVSMITGDHEQVAANICEHVGIPPEETFTRLLPSDKLAWIQARQEDREKKYEGEKGVLDLSGVIPEVAIITTTAGEGEGDIEQGRVASGEKTAGLTSGLLGRGSGKKQKVLMVGDGINDSTALTAATVGVAMGAGGSAMAVASADVILMTDNLQLLPPSIRLCRMARDTMIQGFVFAIAIKIVAIVLAILGKLRFWHAIIIDIGSLVIVCANGVKPLYFKFDKPAATAGEDATKTA